MSLIESITAGLVVDACKKLLARAFQWVTKTGSLTPQEEEEKRDRENFQKRIFSEGNKSPEAPPAVKIVQHTYMHTVVRFEYPPERKDKE